MSDRIPFRVRPMLATLVAQPFNRPGWQYEEKYDGYRILGYKEGDKVRLISRNAKDRTASYPAIAEAIAKLPDRTLLLDGEVVAFDSRGVSRFQLLQQSSSPSVFVAFDCLYSKGRDLRHEPLSTRRTELEDAIPKRPDRIVVSRKLAKDGIAAYRRARRKGLEGLVAKDWASLYEERRSRKWLKVKVHQEEEFVIGGFTAPRGSREHIGALLLGAYRGKNLNFVGKVGTGFSRRILASLVKSFAPVVRYDPPFIDPPREKEVTWLEPRLVAQIAFEEWTGDFKLRQPVFLGLRDDKKPRDCVLPEH
jgi:bifunctional non-homologous end joining protein LigD